MSGILKLFLKILETFLPQVSEELKEVVMKGLDGLIDKLEEAAAASENKFDDLLVQTLRSISGIPDYPDDPA